MKEQYASEYILNRLIWLTTDVYKAVKRWPRWVTLGGPLFICAVIYFVIHHPFRWEYRNETILNDWAYLQNTHFEGLSFEPTDEYWASLKNPDVFKHSFNHFTDQAQKLGKQHWELVSSQISGTNLDYINATFKRAVWW